MLLDIIVPHYDESWEIVRPFFDMLNSQRNVDFSKFRVWLVHNGSKKYPNRYFKNTPVQIKQIELEQKGVSIARNYGIDHADATWIAFCDCDDRFTSIFSLMMIFHILESEEANKYDLVWNSFYMSAAWGVSKYEDFNPVFIHNKYYRLSFLKEHDIHFCEDLYMSEDSAFNTIVRLEIDSKRVGTINSTEPLYAWCRRPGSITMDFNKWMENVEGHFKRNLYVLSEYRKRNYVGAGPLVGRTIVDVYAMLSKREIQGDPTWLKQQVAKFYLENEKIYKSLSEGYIQQSIEFAEKECGINDKDREGRPSLDEWIAQIVKDAE